MTPYRSLRLSPSPTIQKSVMLGRATMMFLSRHRKAAIVSACLLGLTLVGLSAVFSQKPIGRFGSYKMLPHAGDDVFYFTNGLVSHETCCGQRLLGSYERSSDGTWIWRYEVGQKKVYTNEFVLEPGLFWMTCTDIKSPTNTWRLPRRLFAPKEMD